MERCTTENQIKTDMEPFLQSEKEGLLLYSGISMKELEMWLTIFQELIIMVA